MSSSNYNLPVEVMERIGLMKSFPKYLQNQALCKLKHVIILL